MKLKIFLTVLLNGLFLYSLAQAAVFGKIIDAGTDEPLENVSIYFDKTQIGTKTNIDGRFHLDHNPNDGKLIISCVGYEKLVLARFSNKKALLIKLQPINNELQEVAVKQQWGRWGELFTKLLMGDDTHSYYSSRFGSDVVLNKYDVSFSYAEDEEKLTANSSVPLLIYNAQTGYLVKVQLEEFSYLLREDLLKMKAAISIEETSTTQSLSQLQIATNNAYYGSLLHFCNALAKGKLIEEGFTVKKFVGVKNLEKKRVMDILCNINNIKYALNRNYLNYHVDEFTSNIDTARYFKKILRQNDFISNRLEDIDISKHLNFDSASNVYTLKMKDTLHVTYLKNRKNELSTNVSSDFINQSKIKKYESLICFPNHASLEFSNYGKVHVNEIVVRGYMNSNRLSHALPNGFKPELPRVKVSHDALKNYVNSQDERP